jgi:hypothetical protein
VADLAVVPLRRRPPAQCFFISHCWSMAIMYCFSQQKRENKQLPPCRGSEDAEAASSLAQRTLGSAIRAQGPSAVLAVVPLDLQDVTHCDMWLLPLLRKYASGSSFLFWGEYMLPRARAAGSMAAAARKAGVALTLSHLQNRLVAECRSLAKY